MKRFDVARLVRDLEAHVMQDGFDGYFFNSSEDPAAAIQALEAIGAERTAAIVRRACSRIPGGMPPPERFTRQGVLLDVVDANEEDAFHDDDRGFFAYPEDLGALLGAYLRSSG